MLGYLRVEARLLLCFSLSRLIAAFFWSSWMRSVGTTRPFVGNAMGGLRVGSNLASWVVAGSLTYYLWVKPAREIKKEQEVGSMLLTSDVKGLKRERREAKVNKKNALKDNPTKKQKTDDEIKA